MILHMGKETTAPHDCTKTQHQWTIDWTKNILIFSTLKLTKTISPTVWLKLIIDFKKRALVTRCTLIKGLFSICVCVTVTRDSSALLGVSWLIYKFFLCCWFCVCLLLLSHQYFFNVGGCIHIIIRLEWLIILVSVDIRHHVYWWLTILWLN